MKKRSCPVLLLITVLSLLMVLSVFPAAAVEVVVQAMNFTEGASTLENAGSVTVNTGNPTLDSTVPVGQPGEGYLPSGSAVTTADEFAIMHPQGTYYLAENITLEETYVGFEGVFDGNGKTITTTVPIFNAPKGATIKNLTVEGNIVAVAGGNTAAVASGTSIDCNFFNILNKANVAAPDGATGEIRASGIAGRTAGRVIFERCTNEGAMTAPNYAAGILALASADAETELVMVNCTNKGAVTATSHAGGIVTVVYCNGTSPLFYGCRNEGAILVSEGSYVAGGIVATAKLDCNPRFENCTNAGTVTSNEYFAGGIAGYVEGSGAYSNCVNEATGTVKAGPVGTSDQRNAGGIVGRSGGGSGIGGEETRFDNCKNYAYVEGSGQTGGIVGWAYSATVVLQKCENHGEVTSRRNYAGGIACRVDYASVFYMPTDPAIFSDCVNTGKVTAYKGQIGGMLGYGQSAVHFYRCVNSGLITYREDSPESEKMTCGGILGSLAAPSEYYDCINTGEIVGKAGKDGTAAKSGMAGGIAASTGNTANRGVVRVIRCINTGNVKLVQPEGTTTVATNSSYAGGILGYHYGNGRQGHVYIRYCINTGNVTAPSVVSLALGYSNAGTAYIADNILLGTLTSTILDSTSSLGAAVRNALLWNNESTLEPSSLERNYLATDYAGALTTHNASTDPFVEEVPSDYAYRVDPASTLDALKAKMAEITATHDVVTEIATVEDLMKIADAPFGYYKLTADLDLTVKGTDGKDIFTTIDAIFGGTLDGDGHTLTTNKPVFDSFCASARTENLVIAGEVTGGGNSAAYVVRGAGYFKNVVNNAKVTATGGHAGGILAYTDGAALRMENCVNNGDVVSTNSGSFAGGMAAYVNGGITQFVDCLNTGDIESPHHTGGILGSSQRYGTSYIRCTNSGTIKSTNTSTSGIGAAGIQGYSGTDMVYALDCLNIGDVVAGPYTAGILGDSCKGLRIFNCVNTGNITSHYSAGGIFNKHTDTGAKFLDCYNSVNIGTVTGKGKYGGGIAGIVNQAPAGVVTNIVRCINVGNVTTESDATDAYNCASLLGYVWGSTDQGVGINVQNCIAGGNIKATGASSSMVAGYLNSSVATIKNNILCANLTASQSSVRVLYYGTNTAALADAKNISGNLYLKDTGYIDAYKAKGGTAIALGAQSSNNIVVDAFAFDVTKVSREMLYFVGLIDDVNGKIPANYGAALAADVNVENSIGVYGADGAELGRGVSFEAIKAYMTDGVTVKLLANFYSSRPVEFMPDGVDFTFDGNGFTMNFGAAEGQYMFRVGGSDATVTLNNLKVFSLGAGVALGNRLTTGLNATVTNAQIYAGSRYEGGLWKQNGGTALGAFGKNSVVTLNGDTTTLKNLSGNLVYAHSGMTVVNGTFDSVSGNAFCVTGSGETPIVIQNGNFTTAGYAFAVADVIAPRRVDIQNGTFTGGASAVYFGSGTTLANAQLYILGGSFTATTGSVLSGGNAKTKGLSGEVYILGGSFASAAGAGALNFKGSQSWYFLGGDFSTVTGDFIVYDSGSTKASFPNEGCVMIDAVSGGYELPEGLEAKTTTFNLTDRLFNCKAVANEYDSIRLILGAREYTFSREDEAIILRGSADLMLYGATLTMQPGVVPADAPAGTTANGDGAIVRCYGNSAVVVESGKLVHTAPAVEGNHEKSTPIVFMAGANGFTVMGGGEIVSKNHAIYVADSAAALVNANGGTVKTPDSVLYVAPQGEAKAALLGGEWTSENADVLYFADKTANCSAIDPTENEPAITISGEMTLNAANGTAIYLGAGCLYELLVEDGATLNGKNAMILNMNGNVTIDGGNFNATEATIVAQNLNKLEVNGGTFVTTGKAPLLKIASEVETYRAPKSVTINGGSFVGTTMADAVIEVGGVYNADTKMEITGGTFKNNGMAVLSVGAGKLENGIVSVACTTMVTVRGGEFTATSGTDAANAAVLTVGTENGYGTLMLAGGRFIDQNAASEQVVLKANNASELVVNGGMLLAGGQTYYTNSVGKVDVRGKIAVDPAYHTTMQLDGTNYYVMQVTAATNENLIFSVDAGAGVRMNQDSTGIRFISHVPTASVLAAQALAGSEGTITYGTVIAPYDYVSREGVTAFTMAELDAKLTDVAAGKRYLNIVAAEGLYNTTDGIEIRCAMTDIKAANYDRAFAAIAYIKVETTEGATYFYGTFDNVTNVRSIAQVAKAALADVQTAMGGVYIYETADGKFSRYSSKQQDVLRAFAGM